MEWKKFNLLLLCIISICIFHSCDSVNNNESFSISSEENTDSLTCEVYSSVDYIDPITKPSDKELTLNDFRQKISTKNTSNSSFEIDNQMDTAILLPQGTAIQINALSFVSKKTGAPVTGKVRVEAQEYYRISDCIKDRITTQTSNDMLESGGMVNLKVFSGNDECELAKGQKILMAFSGQIDQESADIYYGQQNKDDLVVWSRDRLNNVNMTNSITRFFNQNSFDQRYRNKRYFSNEVSCNECKGIFTQKELSKLSDYMFPGQIKRFKVRLVINNAAEVDSLYVINGLGNKGDSLLLSFFKRVKQWVPPSKADPTYVNHIYYNISIKAGNFDNFYLFPHVINSENMTDFEYDYIINNRKGREEIAEKERESIKEKINSKENRLITDITQSSMNQFIFESRNLGWINCDRLYNVEPAILAIHEGNPNTEDVYVVLKKRRSVISPVFKKEVYFYDRLPLGEEVVVFGMRVIDGGLQLAVQELELKKVNETELQYYPTTYADLNRKLAMLDANIE